jgi:hypothetical protein
VADVKSRKRLFEKISEKRLKTTHLLCLFFRPHRSQSLMNTRFRGDPLLRLGWIYGSEIFFAAR